MRSGLVVAGNIRLEVLAGSDIAPAALKEQATQADTRFELAAADPGSKSAGLSTATGLTAVAAAKQPVDTLSAAAAAVGSATSSEPHSPSRN
jgi:hypothetical protein